MNNGTGSRMAKGAAIQELMGLGWKFGRLKTESLVSGARKGGHLTGGHNKGKSCSDEQKAAISKKLQGSIPWNKGKEVWSTEDREQMSKERRGRLTSEETKRKQSLAAKKYWQSKNKS